MVCFPGPAGAPVLAVTVADCLPVFLLDLRSGSFAALHSGWKGTGIVLTALALMKERGTRPEETAALLGPCIRSCCYRVDDGRAAFFEAEFGPSSLRVRALTRGGGPFPLGSVVRRDGGGSYLDLQAANARLLAAAGVRHIAWCEDCTFTDERLGSYRREGPGTYTRMAAMAGLFPA
jgi:YfiH family protein